MRNMHFIDPHHTPIDLEEIFKQIQSQLNLAENDYTHDDATDYHSSSDFLTDQEFETESYPKPYNDDEDEFFLDEELLNELFSLMKESLNDLLEEDELLLPKKNNAIVFLDDQDNYNNVHQTNHHHDYYKIDDDTPYFIQFHGTVYHVEAITPEYIPDYYGDWESFFLSN